MPYLYYNNNKSLKDEYPNAVILYYKAKLTDHNDLIMARKVIKKIYKIHIFRYNVKIYKRHITKNNEEYLQLVMLAR